MSTVSTPVETTTVPPPPTPYPWPADLLEFARKHDVERILEPMLDVTRRMFPTARSIRVYLQQDLADANWWDIIYEVWAAEGDDDRFRESRDLWYGEWRRIDPRPKMIPFVLDIRRERR